MLQLLEERNFPVRELRLLASGRSKGRKLKFKGQDIIVEELCPKSFSGIEIALFSAGASRSREFASCAVESGSVVIDNSSAFRMEPGIPLVVPEINPDAIKQYKKKGIISNPNCTTIVTLMGVAPLHRYGKIKRMVATSFQAVSGAGAKAIAELETQIRAYVNGEPLKTEVFPYQIAFNVLPHIDVFLKNGYTKEEMKLINETKKILGDYAIKVSPTTVRVPVFRAHSVAVNIQTKKKITRKKAIELINAFPGVEVEDDPSYKKYPMPLFTEGKDNCFVGRIREDDSVENGLNLWVVGDQLRKGAAH